MTRTALRRATLVLLAGTMGLVGCLERELQPLNPCTISGVARRVNVDSVEEVDLLLMIDNSGSMEEEQASLASEIPRLIQVLTTGVNGDEMFTPVKSLRVGIVSSDLGTGPSGACGSQFGDDGVLITTGNTAVGGCSATYPSWLEFSEGEDATAFAADVNCIASSLGINGCGFEQQLEVILKALTPSSSPIRFAGDTVGHGDGQNRGFVRPNSLLAIIALTDEDDCSAIDQGLFVQDNPAYDANLNLRCYNYKDSIHPIQRYVDGLIDLRAGNPDLLIYATITGVPVDLVPDSDLQGDAFVSAINSLLADDRMREQPNPMVASELLPSCEVEGRGRAFPPIRMVSLARDLEAAGSNGVVQSICQADFSGALDAIIAKIADVLRGACLPRPLTRNAAREVECDVVEILDPAIVPDCSMVPGREADGSVDHDDDSSTPQRPRCIVNQIVVAADNSLSPGSGWFYDDFSTDVQESCGDPAMGITGQRISFTDDAEPRNGSEIRLECLQSVQGSAGVTGVGTDCSSDPTICSEPTQGALDNFGPDVTLVCDSANTNTCQPTCANNSDCPGGYVCFDADGPEGITPSYCINPTCN